MHRAVKPLIIAAILLLSAGFVIWDQLRAPSSIKVITGPEVFTEIPAPDASFTSLDGASYSLHDFKGQIILLNFWATWCPPCVAEFPQLLELSELGDVTLIAVSVDDDPQKIKSFIRKLPPEARSSTRKKSVIIAHDSNKKIAHDIFQSMRYPETFIIDTNMIIRKKVVGITDWTSSDMLTYLNQLRDSGK